MPRSLVPYLVLLASAAAPTDAQVRPAADTAALDTVQRLSPRNAMIRSWLLPGWGQATVGVYTRGAFFFAAQTTSGYMLFRSIGRLSSAKGLEGAAVRRATDSLNLIILNDPNGEGLPLQDPLLFQQAVDDHPAVDSARALVRARARQRQDWITYTIFLTLMSGVDAFVAAHLSDAPVSITGSPSRDGGFTLHLRIPAGPHLPQFSSKASGAGRAPPQRR